MSSSFRDCLYPSSRPWLAVALDVATSTSPQPRSMPTMRAKFPCVRCGRAVEPARECYAHPTCYRCLPPPEPLERVYGSPQPVQVKPVIRDGMRQPPIHPCKQCGALAAFTVTRPATVKLRGEHAGACKAHVDAIAVAMTVLGGTTDE